MKKLAIERLEGCKSKDRQIASLKYLMQQAIFHMLIDVKEMLDKTQEAKESLGKEVEGFDEENYTVLQDVRLTQAQLGLTKIRHTDVGKLAEGVPELYERRVDTKHKLECLMEFQDDVQTNIRKISMSLGANISGFMKFVKNRLTMVNNSIKRQAMLI